MEPPIVPRARVAACPIQGSARASSGSRAGTSGSRSALRCRVMAPTTKCVAIVANEGELGNAVDVDEARRPRQPHGHHRHQRLAAGDHPRTVVGCQNVAGLVDAARPDILERRCLHEVTKASSSTKRKFSDDESAPGWPNVASLSPRQKTARRTCIVPARQRKQSGTGSKCPVWSHLRSVSCRDPHAHRVAWLVPHRLHLEWYPAQHARRVRYPVPERC